MELHWTPDVLDKLHLDKADHHGLFWWSEIIENRIKKIENGGR